ncbi:MAG: hypothetical protein ACXWDN_16905 [Limisphaerales bacterium]
MSLKRKISGGIIGFVGFMLSPLSWWNDAFVNLPLAVAFGWLISLVYKPAFEPAVVVGYWLTNVAGFVLMHKGGVKMVSKDDKKYSGRDFLRDVGISLAYTLLIVVLIKWKVLQPISDYFKH